MNRKFLAIFSIALIVISAFLYNHFSGTTVTEGVYSQLSELQGFQKKQVEGKYFVLHFWAKWCAPCAEEIPHLVTFAKNAQEKLPNLQVLAVSLDESIEVSKQILPEQGNGLPSNFLLFLDSAHSLAEAMGSFQYPETYFYDPQGKVIEKWVGPQKWDQPEVMEFFVRKVASGG